MQTSHILQKARGLIEYMPSYIYGLGIILGAIIVHQFGHGDSILLAGAQWVVASLICTGLLFLFYGILPQPKNQGNGS